MNHTNLLNTKTKNSIQRQIFGNNSQFNNVLLPTRRNPQYKIEKRNCSNNSLDLYNIERDHSLSSIKTNNRIFGNNVSMSNIKLNEENNICINLQEERILSSNTIQNQQKQSSQIIENISSITRECSICLLEKPIDVFKKKYNNQCKHNERKICDECIYNYIKVHIKNSLNNKICCPELNCLSEFNFESIFNILNLNNNIKLFEYYDRQLTYKYLEENKEFVWCSDKNCNSGQFHDMGLYSNSMFICIKCKKRTCAYHRIPWHIGMTCQQYDQTNISSIDYNTKLWLNKNSKKCPKCQSYIEKISGCDHMTCRKCKYEFCWLCFADYYQIHMYGLKYHMIYCPYYPSTQKSTICNIL